MLPVTLIALLSVLVGILAYQAPPAGRVAVGWLGDRFFLDSSAGLGTDAVERGDFYADDLTPDSPTGRSRWTRQHARLRLPNLGSGTTTTLTLLVQGWPDDVVAPVVAQPRVTVEADGRVVGSFVPTSTWETYTLTIPARDRTSADLTIDLRTSASFTDTKRHGPDPRPKGIRLAAVQIHTPDAGQYMFLPPAWNTVGTLLLAALLLYILLLRLSRSSALGFVFTILGIGLAGIGLALLRIWMGVILNVALVVLLLALLLAWQHGLRYGLCALLRRYTQGHTLNYGLMVGALAWLSYVLARFSQTYQAPGLHVFRDTFPDSLLYGLLSASLLALTLVLGQRGLPHCINVLVSGINRQPVALLLLVVLGGAWLAYQATVIASLPYVGHADYSDNAVVARNLVAGRGWVVDYVTQFYRLYDGVTRPQETWPLLQPLWIAPFLALAGPHAWAVKIPNLIFNVILLLLIYHIGTYFWDRRVGLTAALLTLTSHLFFKLTIYATSDLAFVVFTLAAIYLLYRGTLMSQAWMTTRTIADSTDSADMAHLLRTTRHILTAAPARWLIAAGVLTGLMMLQKPSGAMIAVGMGLWLLGQLWAAHPQQSVVGPWWEAIVRRWTATVVIGMLWALPALLVLSPYLLRNLVLFGTPVYSTERYDAWVLGYRGDSSIAWEDIYRVYASELGGPGRPDRSWILRWGFDYSFAKFLTQVRAARDYLVPAWTGRPEGLAHLFSSSEGRNLLSPAGAWLSLLGILAAIRFQRSLLSLLLLASGVYTLFLMTYWRTNEERYFVMLVPWLTLLAAWIIWAGYDRLATLGHGCWSPLGLLLVVCTISSIIQPSWPLIADKVQDEPARWAPDLAAYDWLRTHTPPDTVIMARNPWQLNWHAERPAVMIPNTPDMEMLLFLADHYNARYLILEHLLRVKSDAASTLAPLIHAQDVRVGDTIAGFTLVYISQPAEQRVLIYRFPSNVGTSQR